MKYTKNEDSSHALSFLFKNSFNFLKFWKYLFNSASDDIIVGGLFGDILKRFCQFCRFVNNKYCKFLYFFDNLCNVKIDFFGISFFSVRQGLQNLNPALVIVRHW